MTGEVDQIARLAGALSDRGALKLWSVIVTILGDMDRGGVAEVPGTVLSAVISRVGLQSQAMRVAIHRLKRDGWVESRREARLGYYSLSETGRRQTEAVSDRIYGRVAEGPADLRLVVTPTTPGELSDGAAEDRSVLPLTRNTFLMEGGIPDQGEGWLSVTVDRVQMPPWANELAATAARETDFADLVRLLQGFETARTGATALDAFALRVLVLHAWRRLVLRSNPVAETVLGKGSAVAACRARVLALLEGLPRPAVATLLDTG